jgi:hypothetical protein
MPSAKKLAGAAASCAPAPLDGDGAGRRVQRAQQRRGGAPGFGAQQAAVRRVHVLEETVVDGQRIGRAARCAHLQHDVGAVDAVLDGGRSGVGGRALATLKPQPPQRIGLDVVQAGAHLAPGKFLVGVGVQVQHRIEVAQRDVPAQVDAVAIA